MRPPQNIDRESAEESMKKPKQQKQCDRYCERKQYSRQLPSIFQNSMTRSDVVPEH